MIEIDVGQQVEIRDTLCQCKDGKSEIQSQLVTPKHRIPRKLLTAIDILVGTCAALKRRAPKNVGSVMTRLTLCGTPCNTLLGAIKDPSSICECGEDSVALYSAPIWTDEGARLSEDLCITAVNGR